MTTLLRLLVWIVWCAAIGGLWWAHLLGGGMALTAGMLGLSLFAWPASTARRRRGGELRYIELAKQPMTAR